MATVDARAGHRHRLGAHVPAIAALWLWRRVSPDEMRRAANGFEAHGDRQAASELRFAAAELEQAATQVRTGDIFTSATGTTEQAVTEISASSDSSWLTTVETGVLLARSDRYVRVLAASGRLLGIRRGRSWLIDRRSVEDYLDSRRRE